MSGIEATIKVGLRYQMGVSSDWISLEYGRWEEGNKERIRIQRWVSWKTEAGLLQGWLANV